MSSRERAFVELIRGQLGALTSPELLLGIGDDAACLRWPGGQLVVSVDAQVEGSHFKREWVSLRQIGYRSFQAAVSDLAAMGAEPVAAVSNLSLPKSFKKASLKELLKGQAEAAAGQACPIVGGNLAQAEQLSIVTTVFGRAERSLTRAGAKPGHELWLIGEVGLARAGFEVLSRGVASRTTAVKQAISAWRMPEALVARGLTLAGFASAAIDISDGLAGDAANLAESSGVSVVFDEARLREALPAALPKLAQLLEVSALELGLYGGEDYALLATGHAHERPDFARPIGEVREGRGAWLEAGSKRVALRAGFDHFR